MEEYKFTPFNRIALCFSGGGYRAAGFTLGILSYLSQVPFDGKTLLKRVEGLSTVSGGTLTGATYAAKTIQDEGSNDEDQFQEKFAAYYKESIQLFEEDKLLDTAIAKYADDALWQKTDKRRSLINAFSLAYKELFTDATMADLQKHKYLKDICFNATDFSFGLPFRFQLAPGYFGNYRLQDETLGELRGKFNIADAMAASSCFPLGFEPIIMPDDFFEDHTSPEYLKLKKLAYLDEGVGLMDGGIVDNQGIGSIMLANKRKKPQKDDLNIPNTEFDLFMVCDVASYIMEPWNMAFDATAGKKNSFNNLLSKWYADNRLLILALLTGLLTFGFYWAGTTFNEAYYVLFKALSWGFSLVSAILLLVWVLGKLSIKLLIRGINIIDKNILPGFLKGRLGFLSKLSFGFLSRSVIERLTSGKKMIMEIFLKQIRRLNYRLFYTKLELENRRITSLIYELTRDEYYEKRSDEKARNTNKNGRKPVIPEPSRKVFDAAQTAFEFGTTLWFDKNDKRVKRAKNLIACGQFTACFNLLEYAMNLPEEYQTEELKNLTNKLQKDWEAFVKDPFWLY